MRVKRCLYISAFFLAGSALAVDPFSLRIYTPVGSDYFIKTLNEGWWVDSYDKTFYSNLEHAEKKIPNHKKSKDPAAKYSVSGQMNWTSQLSEQTPVQKRAFWVGKGDSTKFPDRDLLKCTVSPGDWPKEDIWLFLGPKWSYTDKGECDSLQAGWLKCLGNATSPDDWYEKYFVRPDDVEVGYGCEHFVPEY